MATIDYYQFHRLSPPPPEIVAAAGWEKKSIAADRIERVSPTTIHPSHLLKTLTLGVCVADKLATNFQFSDHT